MGIAELVVASAAALMQAIDTWGKFRDRRQARDAYETELQRAQASEQVKSEAKRLEVVPESVLNEIHARITQCWTNFKSALDADLAQEEVDLAMNATIRCWCREVNRIRALTGELPTGEVDFASKWEEYNCAAKIKVGI
jgi:hypothetical protein